MNTLHADLLVIGFGKGGKTLAAAYGRAGRRVIMVEQSAKMYGGTCINIGCVPTKALIHQASARPQDADPAAWYAASVASTATITSTMRHKNFRMLDVIDSVTVVTGTATFLDDKKVEIRVNNDRLEVTADTIAINTGAEPFVPEIPGLRASSYLVTSAELIGESKMPRSLAVIGGGYQGLECAALLARYDIPVTIIESSERILPREDDDVASAMEKILTDSGITLITGAHITKVTDTDGTAIVNYDLPDAPSGTVKADMVFVATGRRPRTAELDLEAAGIATGHDGAITVDRHLRTSRPHIFALGDVNGGPQFTYVSLDDYRIVADQLLGNGTRSTADRLAVPYTVFTTPPLARVGLTETQAREAGRHVRVATKDVAALMAMPRATIMGDTRGTMKFVLDADTDEVLGAAILSIDAQELINTVALAIRTGVTASTLRDTIYTHPSSTEAFNEVLAEVVR
jgi:probable pyridine nucleotide-disulfide oxidoreductase